MQYTEIIMAYAMIKCPLCEETARYKVTLRKHINMEHTEIEADMFIMTEKDKEKKK